MHILRKKNHSSVPGRAFGNSKPYKILLIVIITGLLFFPGLFLGRTAGNALIGNIIKGGNSLLFFYRLPFEYFRSSILLSSPDELKRMEGYYSLLDTRRIDADFLIQRHAHETGLNKAIIIWLLGFAKDKDQALSFLSEEYLKADDRQKSEILKTMKRIDEMFYSDFFNNIKK